MPLEYFHPHSILPTATLVRKPLCDALCVRGQKRWWSGLMWVEAQMSSPSSGHHPEWVSTHTVLITPRFFEERSHLCLMICSLASDDTLIYWVVCVLEMSLMLIQIFIYCASMMMPFTFRLSYSRHGMSFIPNSHQTFPCYKTTLWSTLP